MGKTQQAMGSHKEVSHPHVTPVSLRSEEAFNGMDAISPTFSANNSHLAQTDRECMPILQALHTCADLAATNSILQASFMDNIQALLEDLQGLGDCVDQPVISFNLHKLSPMTPSNSKMNTSGAWHLTRIWTTSDNLCR
ncbi:Hypothetical predicted protein [Pelobates cultripes]|uniref:Uncharacterized protein n=1 Tax=Pelobates cultripes TaxID=61616 RepID=A0AAD1R8Q2_PELCU|nr:Hypothetical predicted protein [Pelobates cultripes]